MTGTAANGLLSDAISLRVSELPKLSSGYTHWGQAVDNCTNTEVRQQSQIKISNDINHRLSSRIKNRSKIYLWIAIVVVILLQIVATIYKSHTIGGASRLTLPPLVWQSTPSCWVTQGQFRFKLFSCDQIGDGTVIEVTGRLAPDSAGSIFQQKKLTHTSFLEKSVDPSSALYWQSLIYRLTAMLREWLLEPIRQTVSYPEEVLAESFILGSAVVLPESIEQSVKVMGIAHVIAVSGSHLTLLISILLMFVKSGKRKINTAILISILVVYTTLVGWQPPVTRALLMSVTLLFGKTFFHRQVSVARSLVVSSALMVIYNPWVLFNIGWQLSVFATAGLCWAYPVLTQVLARRTNNNASALLEENNSSVSRSLARLSRRVLRLSLEATFASLAALSFIWPILIASFGSWSWGIILSSLLLWWLFPLVIGSCFVGLIVVRVLVLVSMHPAIVQLCSSLLLEWPVRSITWIFDQINSLEWMIVNTGEWPKMIYVIWYLVLAAALIYHQHLRRQRRQQFLFLQPIQYISTNSL